MTRWGSAGRGRRRPRCRGSRPRRARIRATSACWRALTSSRSSRRPGARRRRRAPPGTFSKPVDALVGAVVAGERAAPAGALAHQQDADAGRAAPLVRRAGGRRPAAGRAGRRPTEAHASMKRGTSAGRPRSRRPAAAVPTSWLAACTATTATGSDRRAAVSRRRSTRPVGVDRRPTRVGSPGPAGAACSTARARRRSARSSPPWRRRAASRPSRPRCTACGAAGREGDLVGADAEALGDHGAGVVEQQPCAARPAGAAAGGRRTPGRGRRRGRRAPRGAGGRTTRRRGSPPRCSDPRGLTIAHTANLPGPPHGPRCPVVVRTVLDGQISCDHHVP